MLPNGAQRHFGSVDFRLRDRLRSKGVLAARVQAGIFSLSKVFRFGNGKLSRLLGGVQGRSRFDPSHD